MAKTHQSYQDELLGELVRSNKIHILSPQQHAFLLGGYDPNEPNNHNTCWIFAGNPVNAASVAELIADSSIKPLTQSPYQFLKRCVNVTSPISQSQYHTTCSPYELNLLPSGVFMSINTMETGMDAMDQMIREIDAKFFYTAGSKEHVLNIVCTNVYDKHDNAQMPLQSIALTEWNYDFNDIQNRKVQMSMCINSNDTLYGLEYAPIALIESLLGQVENDGLLPKQLKDILHTINTLELIDPMVLLPVRAVTGHDQVRLECDEFGMRTGRILEDIVSHMDTITTYQSGQVETKEQEDDGNSLLDMHALLSDTELHSALGENSDSMDEGLL